MAIAVSGPTFSLFISISTFLGFFFFFSFSHQVIVDDRKKLESPGGKFSIH